MRKIGQNIYDEKNIVPKTNIFEGKYIYRLGIQAPPGTQFLLNYFGDLNNNSSYKEAIIEINQYGIYELDLKDGLGVITSLIFVKGAYENGAFFPKDEDLTFYNKIYVDYIEEVEN